MVPLKKSNTITGGLFPVFGIHPVIEYIRSLEKFIKSNKGKKNEILQNLIFLLGKKKNLLSAGFDSAILQFIDKYSIPVERVPLAHLEQISTPHAHQGVVLLTKEPFIWKTEENIFFATINKSRNPGKILILDRINDIQNFAAMARSAVALGVHWIALSGDSTFKINPVVYKISAGAVAWARIIYAANINTFCRKLMELNVPIILSLSDYGTPSIYNFSHKKAIKNGFALIIGNEQKGIRKSLKKLTPLHYRLPMRGPVKSLNASHAATAFLTLLNSWTE